MMFHKLRLTLTLFNASIIFVLFIILIAGSYHFSRSEISHRSEEMAYRMIEDIKSGILNDLPLRRGGGGPPPGPNFFFVKVSPQGDIYLQSINQPVSSDELAGLVNKALSRTETRGTLSQRDMEYPFWKAPLAPEEGTIILFQDITHDKAILRIQLTALILTGLFCVLLSLMGSFFMANRAMSPVKRAWQQQTDFVSDASHELRTPLAIIQTNLDIVMGSPNEVVADQMKWLRNIREETIQMSGLVDSLLLLARADSNQQILAMRSFDLGAALSQSVAVFEPVATAKGIVLSIFVESTFFAYGDESRIKQVIGILLDNAVRHTAAGGKIVVRVYCSEHQNIFTVSDTGEGIRPTEIPKIFDRFYQIDKSRSHGGAGLGLAIAKCIVNAHSGTIDVISTPMQGTTFSVHLPVIVTNLEQST